MPKPKKERSVSHPPGAYEYKPLGVPMRFLEKVTLSIDEYEALRLVDFEGLDHAGAAEHLQVSRPTCARIVGSAHKKVADALTSGKAIVIEGGPISFRANRFRCGTCGNLWSSDIDVENEEPPCPRCGGSRIIDLAAMGGGRGGGGVGGRPAGRPDGLPAQFRGRESGWRRGDRDGARSDSVNDKE